MILLHRISHLLAFFWASSQFLGLLWLTFWQRETFVFPPPHPPFFFQSICDTVHHLDFFHSDTVLVCPPSRLDKYLHLVALLFNNTIYTSISSYSFPGQTSYMMVSRLLTTPAKLSFPLDLIFLPPYFSSKDFST